MAAEHSNDEYLWNRLHCRLGKTQTRVFSDLGPETEERIKLAKDKFALTCSFEKVIRTLAFRRLEKFGNSFYLKILGIVW